MSSAPQPAATTVAARKQSIGLALIVRDESEKISRAIAQCAGVVDHVTIVDTGSTDDTIELVKATMYETDAADLAVPVASR